MSLLNLSFIVLLGILKVVHQINKEDIGTPEELMKIMRDTIKSLYLQAHLKLHQKF